jgi:hypothetical protein
MRKIIIVSIAVLCFVVPELPAQRYLPGMQGLQVTSGGVNALKRKKGYHVGVAFSQYNKRADRWVFCFEYLEKKHTYKNLNIPQSQFTLDAGYYLKFLSDPRKTFFASIGASFMAGYETVNWNEKLLFDGATIKNSDTFLIGVGLTLETEVYLSDRIVLLANIRERFLSGSSIGKLNTHFGIGVKIIIN